MPLLSTTTLTSDSSIDAGFSILEIKMQKSLEGLAQIRDMLSTKTDFKESTPVESGELDRFQQEMMSLEMSLKEKEEAIKQERLKAEDFKNEKDELAKQLKSCITKHASEKQGEQEKYSLLQRQQAQLEQQRAQLSKRNETLEATIHQLEARLQNEIQRKEQCELFLRENAEELKATTEGILERDQKLEQLQDNMEYVQRMLEEKDELLESRVVKAQSDAERYSRLQDKLEQLEKENVALKQKLLDIESAEPLIDVEAPKLEQRHKSQDKEDDEKDQRISQLEHELLLTQEKLMDKTSQNKELESAMERVNEHCDILRNSLNESRKESTYRYKKMIGFLEDIRLLKQELNACRKGN